MFQDKAQDAQGFAYAAGLDADLAAWVSKKGKSLMLSASNVVPFPARPRVTAVSSRCVRAALTSHGLVTA